MNQDYKTFIQNILEEENKKLGNAEEKYWECYIFALESYWLLNNFVESMQDDGFVFMSALSHIQKNALLSVFSVIRWHINQYYMNLRQAHESICISIYSLLNNDIDEYLIKVSKYEYVYNENISNKIYHRFKINHKNHNDYLFKIKKIINKNAHANIIWHGNIKLVDWQWLINFFDELNYNYEIEELLRNIGSIIVSFFDMFYLIYTNNNITNVVNINSDFLQNFKQLLNEDIKLRWKLKALKRIDYNRNILNIVK